MATGTSLSNYLENKLLDHSLGTAAYPMPTAVYVGLFTADPTEAGTGPEVTTTTYPSYTRKVATFTAAANGTTSNTADLTWNYDGSTSLTISHSAIFDAQTGGNMLWYGPLTASKTISNGDVFRLPVGSSTASLD